MIDRGSLAAELFNLPPEGPVDFVIAYDAKFPAAPIQQLADAIAAAGLSPHLASTNLSYRSGLEWAMPALIDLWILKPFWEEFAKSLSKDAYILVKAAVVNLANKALAKTGGNPADRSRVLGVQTGTKQGEQVRFVFPEGKAPELYTKMVDDLFEVVGSGYGEGSTSEKLSLVSSRVPGRAQLTYLEYDVDAKQWVRIDYDAEVAKVLAAERHIDQSRPDIL